MAKSTQATDPAQAIKVAKAKPSTNQPRRPKNPSGSSPVHGAQWFQALNTLLRERSVGQGFALLDKVEHLWRSLNDCATSSCELLLALTQWVDVGYRDTHFLGGMINLISREGRLRLGVCDYVRLRMAEAFYSLAVDDVDETIRILKVLLQLDRELLNAELKTLAHLWKGRAHRKKAEYEEAFHHICAARELAAGLPKLKTVLAIIQIQEGWLIFQRGDVAEALRIFDQAECVLKLTDHWIALGNIESARGRIVRRNGDYVRALNHFERAIDFYEIRHPNHPNLARAITNHAFVKRLLALQLKRHIDSSASQRNVSGKRVALRPLHNQYQELYQSAITELDRAKRICELNQHHHGHAAVLLNAGNLHLDIGNLELAAREGYQTYELANRINSTVLKARAKILIGLTDNARLEELLGNPEDAPALARSAKQHCLDAVALAQTTQNKRLLINAELALGAVAANGFFRDYELARHCVDLASALIEPGDGDYIIEELSSLRVKLLQTGGIDDVLRAWSQGIAPGKTLQQVIEQFSELFVTQIWIREGRKISRVAKRLTMSPKKVRLLVKRAGIPEDSIDL